MISGSLLLKRDYEDKDVLSRFIRHNWLQLFITTEIWLAIMYWLRQFYSDSILITIGPKTALIRFFQTLLFINQDTMASMWYMPMILCVYLMIPVISVGIKHLGNKLFAVLCAIVVVSAMILPNINNIMKALGSTQTLSFKIAADDIFSIYMVYVIAGYWISQGFLEKLSSIQVFSIFALSFSWTTVYQFLIYTTPLSDDYLRYNDIGIFVSGSLLFELIRRKFSETTFLPAFIHFLSSSALGIYFIHICIMEFTTMALERFTSIRYYASFVILEVSALAGSCIIIWLTSRNSYIKKYLYLMK